jgi:tripartite-type tricarboxylate transporter receptor subunit TctC
MLPLRLALSVFLLGMMIPGADAADGQNYPSRVIRIVTTEAGGGSDFNSRMVAQGLTVNLGQQVIVDNRPGTLSTEAVARAAPDGYTLLFNGSTVWLLPFLRDSVPYDPVKDLSPVTLATRAPSILVVHPSLPVKTVKELIALAKARPGEINYAAGVIGAPPHIAGELFKARAGVNIVQVNYKGIGLAFNDVIGGQVQLMFPTAGSVIPHVRSGRLRALAVTTLEPSGLFPGLPTVAASVPGYESTAPLAVFAPAKTPAALINRLNQEIVRVLNTTEVKEKFLNVGIEPVGSSPEQLAARIKSDMTHLGKLIKDAGIRGD